MILKSLELKDFRNYESLNIEFVPGNNIIFGENAQGKTNLLEACFLCASAKSPRGSHDNELIRFGASESHIKAVISKDDSDEMFEKMQQIIEDEFGSRIKLSQATPAQQEMLELVNLRFSDLLDGLPF